MFGITLTGFGSAFLTWIIQIGIGYVAAIGDILPSLGQEMKGCSRVSFDFISEKLDRDWKRQAVPFDIIAHRQCRCAAQISASATGYSTVHVACFIPNLV